MMNFNQFSSQLINKQLLITLELITIFQICQCQFRHCTTMKIVGCNMFALLLTLADAEWLRFTTKTAIKYVGKMGESRVIGKYLLTIQHLFSLKYLKVVRQQERQGPIIWFILLLKCPQGTRNCRKLLTKSTRMLRLRNKTF